MLALLPYGWPTRRDLPRSDSEVTGKWNGHVGGGCYLLPMTLCMNVRSATQSPYPKLHVLLSLFSLPYVYCTMTLSP